MTLTLTLQQAITLLGGFFALVIAVGQLSGKNKQLNNYILAGMLLCFSCTSLLRGFAIPHGGSTIFHFLRITNIATYFLVGPLFMLFFSVLTESAFIHSARQKILFLPVPLSFAIMLAAVFVFSSPEQASPPAVPLMSHICVLWTMIFAGIVIFRTMRILGSMKREKRKPIRFALVFILAAFFLYGLDTLDRYFKIDTKDEVVSFSTILIVGFFILSNRYSFFLKVFTEEAKRIKYENSCIRGLDVENLVRHLKKLMEIDKLYRNEELSLASLADELSISPHQLSELLNTQCRKRFNEYINQYRIAEIQTRLIEEPDQPILNLAFDAGYDSSSTFYTAFRKITGQTPTVFRKKRLQ